jgi:hypothetical protein
MNPYMMTTKSSPKTFIPYRIMSMPADRLESFRLKLTMTTASGLCALELTANQLLERVKQKKSQKRS